MNIWSSEEEGEGEGEAEGEGEESLHDSSVHPWNQAILVRQAEQAEVHGEGLGLANAISHLQLCRIQVTRHH